MSADEVRVSVPTKPQYARVVRMAAVDLAAIVGMTVSEIEDVRIVADEAFVYACETGVGESIEISFVLDEGELSMEFPLGTKAVTEDPDEPNLAYAALILAAMCDDYEMNDGERPTLRLVKRAEEVDARG